jgi:hypothetical protein
MRRCPFFFSDSEAFDNGDTGSAAQGQRVLNWINQWA